MSSLYRRIIKPVKLPSLGYHFWIFIPRLIAGLSLCFEFGSSKFGMPWSAKEDMPLFTVADWFPGDVEQFGVPFSWAPGLFAWLAAASEAIGGLFLALGLGTRIAASLITITMLVAIFYQKWGDVLEYGSTWPILPALGFLWVAIYSILFGSGKFGVDYWISRKI